MTKDLLNNEDQIFMTKEGIDNLKSKLNDLVNVQRPQVLVELAEARKQGDLSENAEYDAAREKQGELEAEILKIESILLKAKEIDASSKNEIQISSVVEYMELNTKKTMKIKIVSNNIEVDPFAEILSISVDSPMGQALLGKKKKDKVTIKLANSSKEIQIIDIK